LDEIQIQNLALHNFTIRNKEWADVVPVKQFHILTDRLGVYTPLFARLGEAARQHPDALVANLLLGGFDGTGYDGAPFFSGAHKPVDGKPSYSNTSAAALSPDSFAGARASIRGRLNPHGQPYNFGNKLTLVVSPALESAAKQILQADFIAQTAANTKGGAAAVVGGVSNVNKGAADLVVLPQLAAKPNHWFLLDTGGAIKPLIVQFLLDAKLSALDRDTADHVFKKHEYLYQAYGVYNAGYGLPEQAFGSTGTA
jgi:phage major head subunit gpT-like protein